MSAKHNDITGHRLSSKIKKDSKFSDNWDKIFAKKKPKIKKTKEESAAELIRDDLEGTGE